jgi:outer membrane protein OmpA-like peptidoglycan-associated protein
MVAVAGVSGCKKQKGLGEVDSTAGGLGEEGLSGGAGSLNEAKSGALGAGGPLEDVQFDYDSFELAEDARLILKRNAEWLTSNRGAWSNRGALR